MGKNGLHLSSLIRLVVAVVGFSLSRTAHLYASTVLEKSAELRRRWAELSAGV